MGQQKIDGDKTLWEISNRQNPTVWEVGRKYDYKTGSYYEVNGKPDYSKKKP